MNSIKALQEQRPRHMTTLRLAKPNSTESNLSTPVAEAMQWSANYIEELEALLVKHGISTENLAS